MVERLLMAMVLVIFGGAIAGGLLAPLTLIDVGVRLLIVVVVRPVTGLLGLVGTGLAWRTRAAIATFGIRGIGSFYYLAYTLNHSSFQEREVFAAAERLWAFLGFVVLSSASFTAPSLAQ